jgi:hypothetical protein
MWHAWYAGMAVVCWYAMTAIMNHTENEDPNYDLYSERYASCDAAVRCADAARRWQGAGLSGRRNTAAETHEQDAVILYDCIIAS